MGIFRYKVIYFCHSHLVNIYTNCELAIINNNICKVACIVKADFITSLDLRDTVRPLQSKLHPRNQRLLSLLILAK